MSYVDDMDGQIEMAHPKGFVASVTVTYVQGRGISARIVSVPGSSDEVFAHEVVMDDPEALCQCSLDNPSLWTFVGIPTEGDPVVVTTIDVHVALGLIKSPEALFDLVSGWTASTLKSDLHLVPEGEPMSAVFHEMHLQLIDAGVPAKTLGIQDDPIGFDELDVDIDSFLSEIFKEDS